MGSYFGWAKRAEGHRISAIHYSKLYRFITVELSLPREERMDPHDFLKYVKDQYDRLQEISPIIPTNIIRDFQRKFKNETEISKPEEANGLEKITVYRRSDEEEDPGRPVSAKSPVSKTLTPKSTFMKKNPLYASKKRTDSNSDTDDEKPFVPTLKAVQETAQSTTIPEVPPELSLAPTKVEVQPS
jgi:hypothetical protein